MRIVVLHAGGLGDLVLLESFVAALRAGRPGARVEVVCRADVAPVCALYAQPPDALTVFSFNPYRWALPDDTAALEAKTLLGKLGDEPVDLFVSAELRATWLSEIVAAALAPREAVIADDRKPRPSDLLILLGKLRLERNRAVRRLPAVAGEHELDRYARLADAGERRLPALRPAAADGAPADELAVFPVSSSPINRWPLAAMGDAAQRVAARRGLALVLVGSEYDRPELEAGIASGAFGARPRLMTGRPDELPAVAARIAGASGYLGIETGLVHLAQAYGVPGATVYGGGYWPIYGPWAARSAAVVAPIPCFGCEWDCAFGHPFCLDGVDADSLVAAFDAVGGDAADAPLVRELDPYSERERAIFAAAGAVHQAAQHDRSARLTAITRLRDLLARHVRRTRARNRQANAALAALADTAFRTAGQLERARAGNAVPSPAARLRDEQ